MKSKFYVLPLMLVLALTLSTFTGCGKKEPSSKAAAAGAVAALDKVSIQLVGVDGVSPLELLQRSHRVYFRGTPMGTFVRGIDSLMADAQASWVFSVNDTMPQVAADKMVTRNGDKVVWHLRYNK